MPVVINGTTGITNPDGTAAAPALTGTDSNTGIFFPAADTIAFAEGGAEAMRINSDGQVGIGTTSPGVSLVVQASVGSQLKCIRTSGVTANFGSNSVEGFVLVEGANPLVFYTNGANERMRIDSSGKVGIGTSSPAVQLDVQATTAKVAVTSTTGTNTTFYAANNTGGSFYFGLDNSAGTEFGTAYARAIYSTGAYPINFYTNGTERARIDSSGNFLINTTSQFGSGKTCISFNGSTFIGLSLQTSLASLGSTFISFINSAGNSAGNISHNGTTTVAYNTTSDYRLKEAIAPMTGALAKVALLKPVTYKWKVDGSDGEGFIAHELQAVVPDCVSGEKDAEREEQYEVTPAVKDEEGNIVTEAVMGTRMAPQYQGIDTSFLVATLTAAIQEQQALITALTTRITALEGAA